MNTLCFKFFSPCFVASYDSNVRVWDCRVRARESVQVMSEAKDSVSSLQLSESEILTGYVCMSVCLSESEILTGYGYMSV